MDLALWAKGGDDPTVLHEVACRMEWRCVKPIAVGRAIVGCRYPNWHVGPCLPVWTGQDHG